MHAIVHFVKLTLRIFSIRRGVYCKDTDNDNDCFGSRPMT